MKVVNSFLARCADALELLAPMRDGLGLGEIAAKLDLPKSATHRLLTAMVSVGWIRQDEKTGFYRLTFKLALLGHSSLNAAIPDICQPILDRLAAESRELVRMAIVDADNLTWVSLAQGANAGIIYQPHSDVSKVPLHASANGKVWLASMPIDDAIRLVLRDGFGRKGQFGPNAVSSIEALTREIELTRSRGWGLAWEETDAGIAAIAVPIRPAGGEIVGSISVAGPVLRVSRERIPDLLALVQAAARDLSALWPLRLRQARAAS
jgi:DNA-binding IclR family transcriptional regulator